MTANKKQRLLSSTPHMGMQRLTCKTNKSVHTESVEHHSKPCSKLIPHSCRSKPSRPSTALRIASFPTLPKLLYFKASFVSEPLTPIRAPITTADATPRSLWDKSMDSTGSVPLSFLMGSANPSMFACQVVSRQVASFHVVSCQVVSCQYCSATE